MRHESCLRSKPHQQFLKDFPLGSMSYKIEMWMVPFVCYYSVMSRSKSTKSKDMDEEKVEWSDLPKELLPTIGKSLDTRIDIVRFRSVCNSWRSSIPSNKSPRFLLKFPNPYSPTSSTQAQAPAYLCESTIYRLQRLNPSTSSNKAWLVKVEQYSNSGGKLCVFDPISNRLSRYPNKTLNLLDFRVIELTKAYMLRYKVRAGSTTSTNEIEQVLSVRDSSILRVTKVVMFPNSPWTNVNDSDVFVIFGAGTLGFAKSGAKSLTVVDDNNVEYDDIIVYKGQFYVIDTLGNVSWIDNSSLKLVPFLPPLCGLGSQKHLVESCGALYVVDRYFNKKRRRVEHTNRHFRDSDGPKVVDFKVYKLNEEWGRWELEKSLGDRAFVLGNDCCLSILAEEFTGYKRNCIYFNNQNETHVFNLEDSSFGDLQDIHPSWLCSNLRDLQDIHPSWLRSNLL